MKNQLIGLSYKNTKIKFESKIVPFFYRGIGLMFKRKSKANALVFDFGKEVMIPIHSYFVFFPFVALWLDEQGKLIDLKQVKPFTFSVLPRRKYKTLIEIPLNSKYDEVTGILVGKKERFK